MEEKDRWLLRVSLEGHTRGSPRYAHKRRRLSALLKSVSAEVRSGTVRSTSVVRQRRFARTPNRRACHRPLPRSATEAIHATTVQHEGNGGIKIHTAREDGPSDSEPQGLGSRRRVRRPMPHVARADYARLWRVVCCESKRASFQDSMLVSFPHAVLLS